MEDETDLEFEVVDQIPPSKRGHSHSKYIAALEAALEHGTISVPFEDSKTAHRRGAAIRDIARRNDVDVLVAVREDRVYISSDPKNKEIRPRQPLEGSGTTTKKASKKAASKKASKKATAKKTVKKSSKKKRPSKRPRLEEDAPELDISDVE